MKRTVDVSYVGNTLQERHSFRKSKGFSLSKK